MTHTTPQHSSATPTPRLRDEQGFSLIEVIVATVIIMIGVTGLVSTFAATHASGRRTLERQRAIAFADELMDRIRTLGYSELGYASKDPLATGTEAAEWKSYCPLDTANSNENLAPTFTEACKAAPSKATETTKEQMVILPSTVLESQPESCQGKDPRCSTYTPPASEASQAGMKAYVYIYWGEPYKRRYKIVSVVVNYAGGQKLKAQETGSSADQDEATVKDTTIIADVPGLSQLAQH